jgi:ElaB/YqjD/DUF883 family membrane-anchored ribosome-binding protein
MSIQNEHTTSTTTGQQYGHDTSGSGSDTARETMSAATGEARHLATEAKERATSLFDRTRDDMSVQMREKSREAGAAMRSLAEEFGHLAAGRPEEARRAREYVEMAEQRLTQMANRLDYGGPDVVVDDIRQYARRHPGMFLAIAAGAGFGIARLTRAARSQQNEMKHGMSDMPSTPSDLSTLGAEQDPLYAATGGVTGVAV